MKNNTEFTRVAAKAALEAGLRKNEDYTAELIECRDGICEMMLTAEWNRIHCFADLRTGEILGMLSSSRSTDEILGRAAC